MYHIPLFEKVIENIGVVYMGRVLSLPFFRPNMDAGTAQTGNQQGKGSGFAQQPADRRFRRLAGVLRTNNSRFLEHSRVFGPM